MNKYKTYKFNSKENFTQFFQGLTKKMDSQTEYNFFVHQISDYHYNYDVVDSQDNYIIKKLTSILKGKFNISQHSSLGGTTTFVGSTKTINSSDILDYSYYNHIKSPVLCIIAIPKYIKYNGKNIEYSTFEGKSSFEEPQELIKAYKNTIPEKRHFKYSLFDVIKKYDELPECYFLGSLINNPNDKNKPSFVLSQSHLSFSNNETLKRHDLLISEKINSTIHDFDTTKLAEEIVKASLKEKQWRDSISDSEI